MALLSIPPPVSFRNSQTSRSMSIYLVLAPLLLPVSQHPSVLKHPPGEDYPITKLRDIAQIIRTQEALFGNITIEGEVRHVDSANSGSLSAETFTAYFEGPFGLIARGERNPGAIESDSPRSPYAVAGFDGSVNLFYAKTVSVSGRRDENAVIDGRSGHFLSTWIPDAAGWSRSIFGYCRKERAHFSDLLSSIAENSDSLHARLFQSPTADSEVILQLGDPAQQRITLNADKLFAISRIQHLKQGRIVVDLEMSDFVALKGDAFYPSSIKYSISTKVDEPLSVQYLDLRVRAYNVAEASRPSILPVLPEGVHVLDKVTGQEFVSSGETGAIEQRLASYASMLREPDSAAATSSIVKVAAHEDGGEPSAEKPRAQSNRRLFLGFGILGCAVGIIQFFRKRRGANLLLLLLCVGLGSSSQAQSISPGIESIPGLRATNCGRDAVGVALSFFEKDVALKEIGARLGIGERAIRPTSLLQIKRALESYDLTVTPLKGKSGAKVAERIPAENTLQIAHLRGGVFGAGHFVILAERRGGRVLICDPAKGVAWYPIKRFIGVYGPYLSGAFLDVTDLRAYPATGPRNNNLEFHLEEKEYSIPAREMILDGQIESIQYRLLGDGSKGWRLKDSKGNCDCYKGAQMIEEDTPSPTPGATAHLITLRIDKEPLTPGRQVRQVALYFETEDGALESRSLVTFTWDCVDGTIRDSVRTFPAELLFRPEQQGACYVDFVLLGPESMLIDGFELNDTDVRLELLRSQLDAGLNGTMAHRRRNTYRATLMKPFKGQRHLDARVSVPKEQIVPIAMTCLGTR